MTAAPHAYAAVRETHRGVAIGKSLLEETGRLADEPGELGTSFAYVPLPTAGSKLRRNNLSARLGPGRTIILVLLITTVWLATRPYVGVIHDSRLYTVQALNVLLHGRFADDLHFLYGSQDKFTTFGLAYQPLLAILGIARGAMLFTIAGQCLWICGLIHLASSIFRDRRTALVAAMLAITLPGGIFLEYGEQFVTPRLFSEAMTMWALGSMLCGHPLRSLVLLCFSVSVHPIMTLPGFAALFLHEATRRRGWWVAAAASVTAAFALAYCNIQPFANILVNYDPAWFAIVRERDFFSFLSKWSVLEWAATCNVFVLAALGLYVAECRERSFLLILITVAAGGLAMTVIGGDLWHNVLITDAQQYRATWPLAVAANLFVAPVILRNQWGGASPLTIAAMTVAGILLTVTHFIGAQGYLIATPVLTFAGLVLALERTRQSPIPRVACIFGLFLLAAWCGMSISVLIRYATWTADLWPGHWRHTALGLEITTIAIILASTCLATSGGVRARVAGHLATACVLAAVATLVWDQRTPWTKFVETTDAPPALLSSLSPTEQVYWEGDVRVPWFVLKRPSYFSCSQGTGAMFFRGTAITYRRRKDSFLRMPTLDFGEGESCPSVDGEESGAYRRENLTFICRNEPELGTVVLTRPLSDLKGLKWVSPVEFVEVRRVDGQQQLVRTNTFFIYSCGALR
jgi:hypothetical protein